MPSLNQFARRMSVTADRLGDNTNRLVRKVALSVDQAVVLATPVDTGRARSNWLVSLGQPRTDTIGARAPGSKLGIDETANAQATLAEGNAIIGRRREGQDVYISNSVDYIETLNNGSSAQAPANFVEQAVLAGATVVRGTRVLTGRVR